MAANILTTTTDKQTRLAQLDRACRELSGVVQLALLEGAGSSAPALAAFDALEAGRALLARAALAAPVTVDEIQAATEAVRAAGQGLADGVEED